MKEINDIVNAYKAALLQGKKTALATVVKIEGSSYRQPGARMLITEDGQLTGAISGGCLEGDALKKALLAIHEQKNKLVTYDTSNEDDVEFGIQLGCNGIVHILFEPIDDEKINNPIVLLKLAVKERSPSVMVTLFSLKRGEHAGTCLFYRDEFTGGTLQIMDAFSGWVLDVKASGISQIKPVTIDNISLEALVEYQKPPIALVIAGAGNDAVPLVEMASLMGWHITVADGRATHATAKRFPKANRVINAKANEVFKQVDFDSQTAFVLMTHNYNYDLALLALLLKRANCKYIGTLGPKTKLERMLIELEAKGLILSTEQRESLFGPVGIDIGAETSEEIAISIIAEIKKIMSGKNGASLKDKISRIHSQEQYAG